MYVLRSRFFFTPGHHSSLQYPQRYSWHFYRVLPCLYPIVSCLYLIISFVYPIVSCVYPIISSVYYIVSCILSYCVSGFPFSIVFCVYQIFRLSWKSFIVWLRSISGFWVISNEKVRYSPKALFVLSKKLFLGMFVFYFYQMSWKASGITCYSVQSAIGKGSGKYINRNLVSIETETEFQLHR
jgi:hypothetical protein